MKFVKYDLRLFKKVPYSVLLSDSEASLTSFGTASPPHFVLPRVARHLSLRSGRRPSSLRSRRRPGCLPEALKRRGTPRLTPRGDSRRACTKTFLVQPQYDLCPECYPNRREGSPYEAPSPLCLPKG
jgi:hypothetical protein